MTSLEKQIETLVERVVRRVLAESTPLVDEQRDRIAECLVRIFYLYNGHRVDSRGPSGCIVDALNIVAPGVMDEIRESSAHEVYVRRWSEDT